jgi:hypothetical protein
MPMSQSMKIGPAISAFPITTGLRTKRNDGDGGAARQQYDPNQNKQDRQDSDGQADSGDESLPEKVARAIESFQADATTVANGLRATLEGQGPGLKIVLKDVNGDVVRNFTGEEFLRLRSAPGSSAHPRGKILDRKL